MLGLKRLKLYLRRFNNFNSRNPGRYDIRRDSLFENNGHWFLLMSKKKFNIDIETTNATVPTRTYKLSSLSTVMPYSESVSMNRNDPKKKGSPKWRRPKPSADKTRFLKKPNFNTCTGQLDDYFCTAHKPAADIETTNEIVPTQIYTLSSLSTVMPYSESVSMNRNDPKKKGSPKWRRPKPSANKTRYIEKPNFNMCTGQLDDYFCTAHKPAADIETTNEIVPTQIYTLSSLSTVMPYSESVSMNRNDPKKKGSPKWRRPKPSANKTRYIEKPNFNMCTGQLDDYFCTAHKPAADIETTNEIVPTQIYTLSSLSTVMPYSESVSMNRNDPKKKGSPKWRRPKPSADKTRFLKKPNFNTCTGQLDDYFCTAHKPAADIETTNEIVPTQIYTLSSLSTVMPYSESVSMNRNDPKKKGSPKWRRPKPSANKTRYIEKPNFNMCTGQLDDYFYTAHKPAADIETTNEIVPTQIYTLSSLSTVMPYSESVSMNRNDPKKKGSPKWRRPKPSADKTRFLKKPNFNTCTGQLDDYFCTAHKPTADIETSNEIVPTQIYTLSSLSTVMPYSESVSMNQNDPKKKGSPKWRRPEPSADKTRYIEKPNFNTCTGQLDDYFCTAHKPAADIETSNEIVPTQIYTLSSLSTVMPYSESVSMNQNDPKKKGSPKWRRPEPTADKNRFLKKPNFNTRTGKLVDVLYGRRHCNSRDDITLLCTYFEANKRHERLSKKSKSFVKNETSNDNFYSDKRKQRFTYIENEPSYTLQYDKPSAKINVVLKDLGFVCNSDKMYTFYPSQIYYYKNAQKHITKYGQKIYIAPKPKNSIGSSDGYSQNGRRKSQKPIHSKTYPENNCYNKNYKIENHHQNSIIKKSYSNQLNCQKNTNNLHQDKQLPIKYWLMRHLLFTNFDRGILLDTESFYSVCPEVLSYHIAKRCKNNIVLDPFCGAGGNIIQLAKTCKRVIACDIDPNKIRLARHNAEIYGVAHKIDFVVGDFFQIYPKLKADVVFMSPPWGGPGYSIDKSYSLTSMCDNYFGGGFGIFDIVKTIAPNIAFHMPKTTNILECIGLANDFGKVEIQQNIINGRLNSITAFYGDFH